MPTKFLDKTLILVRLGSAQLMVVVGCDQLPRLLSALPAEERDAALVRVLEAARVLLEKRLLCLGIA